MYEKVLTHGKQKSQGVEWRGCFLHLSFDILVRLCVNYKFGFDGSHLPNGVYLYCLTPKQDVVIDTSLLAKQDEIPLNTDGQRVEVIYFISWDISDF